VAGLIQIEQGEIAHEMIATTIWGSPTTESASRIPSIPIIGIKKSEGDRLKPALTKTPRAHLNIKVEQGWATAAVVVSDVPGRTPGFVMIATHLDAWYRGMTDTGGSDASILEMARVLQKQQVKLERGLRFAWWPGTRSDGTLDLRGTSIASGWISTRTASPTRTRLACSSALDRHRRP
jgi:hypothetical protein